jgi:hypothetical protein
LAGKIDLRAGFAGIVDPDFRIVFYGKICGHIRQILGYNRLCRFSIGRGLNKLSGPIARRGVRTMGCHLLVVSESGEEGASDLVQCLPEGRWHHARWEGFSSESLLESPPDLLILAGAPDPAFLRTVEHAALSANTGFPVLITGETGVGKGGLRRNSRSLT